MKKLSQKLYKPLTIGHKSNSRSVLGFKQSPMEMYVPSSKLIMDNFKILDGLLERNTITKIGNKLKDPLKRLETEALLNHSLLQRNTHDNLSVTERDEYRQLLNKLYYD